MIRKTDTIIICDCCRSEIARVYRSELSIPLVSNMFLSMMPANGVPDPFPASVPWKHWVCPYCQRRPFHFPNAVTTNQGERIELTIPVIEDIPEKIRQEGREQIIFLNSTKDAQRRLMQEISKGDERIVFGVTPAKKILAKKKATKKPAKKSTKKVRPATTKKVKRGRKR